MREGGRGKGGREKKRESNGRSNAKKTTITEEEVVKELQIYM